MARFVLHVSWIRKQAHAEEVMGHAREQREMDGTLCTQAADEQDPQKLAVLILEIDFMLEAKELGLLKAAQPLSIGEDNPTLQSKS